MKPITARLQKLLLDAGLTEAQVLVYLELMQKPAVTIYELVARTALHKSTVYDAFAALNKLKMVEKNPDGIRALSLKALIAELIITRKKADKTAYELKQIAPFLHVPRESVEELQSFYTPQQIADAYLTMAKLPYDVNLDFGDFESFITAIGTNQLAMKFRELRSKHASNHAICTTIGPNISEFLKKEEIEKYKCQFDFPANYKFQDKWIIFSDKSDYVMYNDVSEKEFPTAILIKSKSIADMERSRFRSFSDGLRNG